MPIDIDSDMADELEKRLTHALKDLVGEKLKQALSELDKAMMTRGDEHIIHAQEHINDILKAMETKEE